ncbi:Probable glutathione S-transferase-related transmembrane protein [Alloactinosynnema sp. L-07]|uniref:SRPBCC family protein n=1 Tax=Alloactinosynnema sp. L-07 TaxID=1653480 RepID=UPI00065EF639|nr:SRPBCC family protein [Alloactinosynnema sp. L-07]CRK61931.1 Probable glutathione S-transferase-related transmembrane protein [Alloactinosynnema sp. L-07]
MSATTKNETRIEADPNLPTITITREFDAPRDPVYRAFTDPELVTQWLGPKSIEVRIEEWDARTGGSYRYTAWRDGEEVAAFYGSFHEARENERIVQTFTYVGFPDGVSLETITFTDLGDGRTRVTSLAVVDTMEAREAMLASGMDVGVNEGYEKLDALLAKS